MRPVRSLLLALALLLAIALPAQAAITCVPHVGAQAATGGNTFTSGPMDSSGTTLLVAAVSHITSVSPTLSDSKSNTWALIRSQVFGTSGFQLDLYYVKNPTVGTGHTFTLTGSAFFGSVAALACSGTDTTANVDQQNGTDGAQGQTYSTFQPGSVTPSVNNEVVVTGLASDTTYTIDGGYTITDQFPVAGGAAYGVAIAYLVQTTATATNPTWTISTASATTASIATFKAAAAGSAARVKAKSY